MNKISLCGVFLFIFTLSGCSGMGIEHVIGNYFLTRTDYSDEALDVSYYLGNDSYIGVVNPTVFAIGFNNDFIIAKQHPADFHTGIDKNITNYFIVPLKFKVHDSPDENKIGPLTHEEFLIKRKELKIPDELIFSKVFKKLE